MQRIERIVRNGYVVATVAVIVATAVFLPGRASFAKGQWALIYLLIVTLVAGFSGTGPAVLAALESFLAWDFFFLPPFITFAIRDPKDLLALLAFLIVGIVLGVQTGRMREQRRQALAREREAALLERLSTYLVSETSTETMATTMLREAEPLVGERRVLLFVTEQDVPPRVYGRRGPETDVGPEVSAGVAWVLQANKALGLAGAPDGDSGRLVAAAVPSGGPDAPLVAAGDAYLPLHAGSELVGVLYLGARADTADRAPGDTRFTLSLANLIAVFLERQHLLETVGRTRAAREADQLKASLLSSISHELKTPLTALTATLSNMLESDTAWDEASAREEVRSLVGDVGRLSNSITALLDLSRLESHDWAPKPDWHDLPDIVETSLAVVPAHQKCQVDISIPSDLPLLFVDFEQWTRVFRHLLENAVVYGGPDAAVYVGARKTARGLVLWVEDDGPGVPESQHALVFEKFYRAPTTSRRSPSGTGLGLAIAREIVSACGGSLRLENVEPHGARFVIELPDDVLRKDRP
jgi:two-component system, OmpR family, sensor histidine kinase KdpD